jgi:alpha-glucosidase
MPGYGHDIGGFAGPRPNPELFVRWVQNGIFHPRFCIHSWKKEGITEPWMYPEVFIVLLNLDASNNSRCNSFKI